MLEWNTAIREPVVDGDRVQATLDLFYKCWSEGMNEVITLTTWGAIRAAGECCHRGAAGPAPIQARVQSGADGDPRRNSLAPVPDAVPPQRSACLE